MKMRMIIFIGLFLLIYGGMHAYIFRKALVVVPSFKWPACVFLTLMVIMPILVAFLARRGFSTLALPFAWVGYLWMGFAFLFFSFSIMLDMYCLVIGIGKKLCGGGASILIPLPFYAVMMTAVIACASAGYGLFAATQIKVETVHIHSRKMAAMPSPFRIVQISDLHLGIMSSESLLRRLVQVIEDLEPDVIVSTGDLVDMQPDHVGRFVDILAKIKAKYGKFAVTGNHEAYVGLEEARYVTRQAGFVLLSNEGTDVAGTITIFGVDDPAVFKELNVPHEKERTLVERYRSEKFVVLLKHQPVVDPESTDLIDLQLSGHTHGGQIVPFNLLTWLRYRVKTGLSSVGSGMVLYVSRGTGTWGPPIRFLAPPEITVIDLLPERARQ